MDLRDLTRLGGHELERRFRGAPAGELPQGRLQGVFLVVPGSPVCRPAVVVIRQLLWQGKAVNESSLRNLVTPLGVPAVAARVSRGRSRLDGGPCTVIDYRPTRLLPARPVRDEVRQIAPGLFLGTMWLGGVRLAPWLTWFALAPVGEHEATTARDRPMSKRDRIQLLGPTPRR